MTAEERIPMPGWFRGPTSEGGTASSSGSATPRFLRPLIHDLRSPLLTARMLIEALRDEDLGARERHRLIDGLATCIESIDEMSLRVFALDRLEEELATTRPTRFDVAEIVAGAVRDADLPSDVWVETGGSHPIIGYRGVVERAVLHMLTNAMDHTPFGTPIEVRVVADRRAVTIVVEDGGPGVPDEAKERIFVPFERAEDPARGGLGLGLALVARAAEAHGGRAWVEDGAAGGASFRMTLPRLTLRRRVDDGLGS